jgi:hypothetical protein
MNVFTKNRLSPYQARTVAWRRLGDARYLSGSKDNERANGVIYLAGLVIECLLKARLLEKYTWLQTRRSPSELSESDRELRSLCYRTHDLNELLARMPEIARNLDRQKRAEPGQLSGYLRTVCGTWTIHVRYSPHMATMREADEFLTLVEVVRPWL